MFLAGLFCVAGDGPIWPSMLCLENIFVSREEVKKASRLAEKLIFG
ncbi:hypothetical protein HNE_2171 [Hyphomonas neptunium ATCC 15444]|uniref:Uncharacterized protein n=2 Tax=Hyphomonas TaxID=85 RepID=Q0C075_HYPNA|nr:hypothetical protein HNE_2171 [Hyphomonas neptunium ATCC 15444]